jgi:dethiobiotin synthetase
MARKPFLAIGSASRDTVAFMRGLLISGANKGAGKTLIGCALAFAAHARGMRVGVMKPVETGCGEIAGALEPSDARALIFAAASPLSLDLVCPYRYRSALAPVEAALADGLAPPDPERVARCYREIAERSDIVIVEGADTIAAPITAAQDYGILAARLGLELAVVVGSRPGCIEAAAAEFDRIRSRGLALAGWILNDCAAAADESVEASIGRATDVRFLGRVRFKQPVPREVIDPLIATG